MTHPAPLHRPRRRLAAVIAAVALTLAGAVACEPSPAVGASPSAINTAGPQLRTVTINGVSQVCTYDWRALSNWSSIPVAVGVSQHYRTPVDLSCFRIDFTYAPPDNPLGHVGAAGAFIGIYYCAWLKVYTYPGQPFDRRTAVVAGPRWIPTNYWAATDPNIGLIVEVGRRTIYDSAGNVTGCKAT